MLHHQTKENSFAKIRRYFKNQIIHISLIPIAVNEFSYSVKLRLQVQETFNINFWNSMLNSYEKNDII